MSYNIEGFIRFLGNDLDGTQRTNIIYFLSGRQRSVGIKEVGDIEAAEKFVKLNDGRRQLYMNINPCHITCSGKPKDSDILGVRNLYLDVDPVKAPGMSKYPATDEEIDDIPLDDIIDFIECFNVEYLMDFTGNGYRFIIPIKGGESRDERAFVCLLHSMFPDYVDTNVVDPSRITGVPGTMNVKDEVEDRHNRHRNIFKGKDRVENDVPIYSEAHKAIIDEAVVKTKARKEPRIRTSPLAPEDLEVQTQELLNKYILRCSKVSPWVLRMIELGPPDGDGFMFDGFFASEIYNKVGNYPRVFATIMKSRWGEQYSAKATEKAWFDTVDNDVEPWSKQTIKRVFGSKIFEEK